MLPPHSAAHTHTHAHPHMHTHTPTHAHIHTHMCPRRAYAWTHKRHIIFPYRPTLYLSIVKRPQTKHFLVVVLRFLGQLTVVQIRIKGGENYFGGNSGVKFPRFIIIDPSTERIVINQENFILEFHEKPLY